MNPQSHDIEVIRATSDDHFEAARTLFREYADWLEVDLCFQGFERELASLESMYAPPAGSLLLAFDGAGAVGCAAVRSLPSGDDGTCEMKRLYVKTEYRNKRIGLRLAEAILEEGRRLGYRRMVLDTLETMERARAVYRTLGFRETAPYYANPLEGVRYMETVL